MIKFFFKNIARIITISFIIITFLPVSGVCIYAYSCLSKNIYNDYYDRVQQVVSGIDSNLSIYFNNLSHITDSIFASNITQSALVNMANTEKEKMIRDQALEAYINNLLGSRADIACVSFYSTNREIFEYNIWRLREINPSVSDVIKKLKIQNGKFTIFGPRYQISDNGFQRNFITVGRQIKSMDNGATIGYLVMDIDYNMLGETIGMPFNSDSSSLFITDMNGSVVYNSENSNDVTKPFEQTAAYHKFAAGGKNMSVLIGSHYFEWIYRILSNGEELFAELFNVSFSFVTVGIISLTVFLLCSILISKNVSKPLRRLEEAMSTAESRNFNTYVPDIYAYEEVSRLTRRFNVMQVEIQRLLDNEKESWRREAESEYKALQLQITPHFLYNSLENINSLAMMHGRREISEMVLSLAGIFKYNMRYDSKIATFEDEIKHVKNYCMLQAVHFQNRFDIRYDVDEKYMDREVVKFMLQPLVENSINHGIKEKGVGNLISLTAYEAEQEFVVQVSDNGAGMSLNKEDQLRKLLNLPSTELFRIGKEGSHIGLVNVNLRLKLQYGEKAGITFETSKNAGTIMYIHIPMRHQEDY